MLRRVECVVTCATNIYINSINQLITATKSNISAPSRLPVNLGTTNSASRKTKTQEIPANHPQSKNPSIALTDQSSGVPDFECRSSGRLVIKLRYVQVSLGFASSRAFPAWLMKNGLSDFISFLFGAEPYLNHLRNVESVARSIFAELIGPQQVRGVWVPQQVWRKVPVLFQ